MRRLTTHAMHPISACISTSSARAPDALCEAVPLREAVEAIVALAHGAHEAAQGVDLVLARVPAVLVDLANGKLDRRVVLGLDDAVGRRALAGDVAGGKDRSAGGRYQRGGLRQGRSRSKQALSEGGRETYRSTSSPRSFSMLIDCRRMYRVDLGED